MKNESLKDLIDQAVYMYLDRPKIERDLIYCIACLDSDSRSALVLAYQLIHKVNKDKNDQSDA